MSIPDETPILEEDEYCVVCLGVDDLLDWHAPVLESSDEQLRFTVCQPCHADPHKFRDWLAGEFEKALEADPTMEKLPNGKWTERKAVNQ